MFLKLESTGFSDKYDVKWERRRCQDDSKYFTEKLKVRSAVQFTEPQKMKEDHF